MRGRRSFIQFAFNARAIEKNAENRDHFSDLDAPYGLPQSPA
jgi:hypothetical protein